MNEKIQVEYSKLTSPFEGKGPMAPKNFEGLVQGTFHLPAGYLFEEGRRPFPVATVLDRDVAIKMRDGVTIYCDVYRPEGDEKVPAIISWGCAGKRGMNNMLDGMGMGPGDPMDMSKKPDDMPPMGEAPGDDGGFGDWAGRADMPKMPATHKQPPRMGIPKTALSGLQAWESLDPAEWVQYGYAIVCCDPRGCYMSEGDVRYFGKLDAEDIYDTIEALAVLPWCNGKVAMGGSSWYAMTQWCAASYAPPHLAAISPWEGEGDLYRDEYMRGGIPMAAMPATGRTFGFGSIEDISKMMDKYPLYNEYWEDKTWDFEKITVPAYIVASLGSQMHCRGAFDGYRRIASENKWLRVHDRQEWVDLYDPESMADLRRFFDHFLKDKNNGWEYTPRVRLSVLDPGGVDKVNVPASDFPPKNQTLSKYYLDSASGKLIPEAPGEASVSYNAEAEDETGRTSFKMTFDKETNLIGYAKIKLWVEAQGYDDMDLFIRIQKTNAQGEILYQDSICFLYSGPDTMLRVSLRELDAEKSTENEPVQTFRTVQKLKPGEIVPIELAFWPTSMVFHPGETLELVVAGYDYMPSRPMDRPTSVVDNKGTHVIHTGGRYDSYLLLPEVYEL